MDGIKIKERLVAVLKQIQTDSGLECPVLNGKTKPVGDIPRFDSKVWPVATTILAAEIGAIIANDVNIFVHDTSKIPRSIDEIAAFVCDLLNKQGEKQATAA